MANPLTAAMTGLGTSRMTRCRASISSHPLQRGSVVAGLHPLLLVASGAKCLVPGSSQDDGTDVGADPGALERLGEFIDRLEMSYSAPAG